MADAASGEGSTSATVARIYDYLLGGTHNFPADREAAETMVRTFPKVPALARTNRAFLRRAVTFLAEAGVRQFLDIGSGIPTAGNVHEIAQAIAPQARVMYVDIDPVAVAESLEILRGNERATAIHGNLLEPQAILHDPRVRELLNFDEPMAVLLGAILHFVPDDAVAYDVVGQLVAALAPGSYLVMSHAALDGLDVDDEDLDVARGVYRERAAMPFHLRTREQIARFFTGMNLVEPGVVWVPEWRPVPGEAGPFVDDPSGSAGMAAVAQIP